MKVAVLWRPSALGELADIWNNAADRNADTRASYPLDQRLAADPLNEGESRAGNERITFEPPLQILFRVSAANRTVYVTSAGVFGGPP